MVKRASVGHLKPLIPFEEERLIEEDPSLKEISLRKRFDMFRAKIADELKDIELTSPNGK